jgi:hypothetical protein
MLHFGHIDLEGQISGSSRKLQNLVYLSAFLVTPTDSRSGTRTNMKYVFELKPTMAQTRTGLLHGARVNTLPSLDTFHVSLKGEVDITVMLTLPVSTAGTERLPWARHNSQARRHADDH